MAVGRGSGGRSHWRLNIRGASHFLTLSAPGGGREALPLDGEDRLTAWCAETLGLPVPQSIGQVRFPLSGRVGSVRVALEGVPLSDPGWRGCSERVRGRLAEDVAGCVHALHTATDRLPESVRSSLQRFPGTDDPVSEARGAIDRAVGVRVISRAVASRLLDRLGATPPPPTSAIESVLHGDLAAGNILGDPRSGRLTGLVDFELSGLGPRGWDFAGIGLSALRSVPLPVRELDAAFERLESGSTGWRAGWTVVRLGAELERAWRRRNVRKLRTLGSWFGRIAGGEAGSSGV